MPQIVDVAEFLHCPSLILDVRSPGEFFQGHIPGAQSFPLFSNDERAEVGTCYKRQGQETAIELGLAIVGPKLAGFVTQAKALAPDCRVRLHCWRGGMRSNSMAWLLETAGFQVTLLRGGYKNFRHWVRSTLATPKTLAILGGMTGTGKTEILAALAEQGEQVLDLENLANHRGSSYGSLGLPAQPTTEQFENHIALVWSQFNHQRPVWIEAESRRIGLCRIPDEIFQQMLQAPVLQILRSRPKRIEILRQVYGSVKSEQLIEATERLRKKLGGLRTQQAVEAIHQGDLTTAIDLVLDYYDKTYTHDLQRRGVPIHSIDIADASPTASAALLMEKSQDWLITSQPMPISITAT
ncbi:tRNA 2-selenouridine(34) synthase MnmH [Trichocoleus desertorum AS-A10]|uniref:tRNA 2-selenouridine(34) synthase MnmH n=1 Tax=Trichocoleus desertorum TaxID=1481672 RepID=UPI0032968754